MSVNFFENECKENLSRTDQEFGLCDDQNAAKAYSDIYNEMNWIAKIKNENCREISFTAIDNCITILKNGNNDQESICDGMLTFNDSLYLVELKKREKGGWILEAKKQLENTIKVMREYHDLSDFRYKKAYACNKKHPNFNVIESSEKKSFFKRTHGFRIDVQTEIVIK